jgi:gluconate 5-dehydrogenase
VIAELFGIEDLNILITGSSRGIGLALAEGMGKCGANIILNGRKKETLKKAAQSLTSKGIKASYYDFDVSRPDQVSDTVDKIISENGNIDVLVNNAGIQIRGELENFDYENFQKVMNINVTSAFLVSKEVVKNMISRKKGKIINICSLMSEVARPTIAPYTASKGAVKNLTKGMATDWGKYNIQINGIGPGYFSSEMTKELVEDKKFNEWICKRTPAGRWGKLDELVGTAIFLSSKASDFVNGQVIYVDGGILSCL